MISLVALAWLVRVSMATVPAAGHLYTLKEIDQTRRRQRAILNYFRRLRLRHAPAPGSLPSISGIAPTLALWSFAPEPRYFLHQFARC